MNELLRKILFLPPQATQLAREIDHLHYFVIIVTMLGAALVTIVGGYFLIKYRSSAIAAHPGRKNVSLTTPLWVEAVIIVGLFGLFIMWWVIGFRQYVHVRVGPEDAMEVYVTGKQWMWKFAYPQGQSSIAVLYVPAGRPVKLVMTSRDVIHSFYVPDARVKQDLVPGRYTTLWFQMDEPGRHEILCAEMCGISHSTMRGEVVVLPPEAFERWMRSESSQPVPPVAGENYVRPGVVGQYEPQEMVRLVEQGRRAAAELGCLRCHTLDGTPHIGPTWAGAYGSEIPLEGGGTVRADEAYLTESMMDPTAKIHQGFQALMPSYLGRMRPPETAAIVELIKSLRDIPAEPGKAPWAGIQAPGIAPAGQGQGATPPAQSPPPAERSALTAGEMGQPDAAAPLPADQSSAPIQPRSGDEELLRPFPALPEEGRRGEGDRWREDQ
jgi:cytochrome c oxidase subunit 2